jgi:hypothetical protein
MAHFDPDRTSHCLRLAIRHFSTAIRAKEIGWEIVEAAGFKPWQAARIADLP